MQRRNSMGQSKNKEQNKLEQNEIPEINPAEF